MFSALPVTFADSVRLDQSGIEVVNLVPPMVVPADLDRIGAMNNRLSHFDEEGASRMVDVGDKPVTQRLARASGIVRMLPTTKQHIQNRDLKKGDVLEVARLAGIMASKRTDQLIPLCHQLPISSIEIDFEFPTEASVRITATVTTRAQTGVEMEALTAVSVTALTIYDMCKAIDRGIEIDSVRLEEKLGGKSGHYVRPESGE